MRRYEVTYIIDSAIEPERIDGIVERANEIISKFNGKIVDEKKWGKRRLAYEIDRRQYGYYVITNFDADSAVVPELEKFFRLNQYVLRYMTIHIDQKELKLIDLDEERKRIEEAKALEAAQANNKSEE